MRTAFLLALAACGGDGKPATCLPGCPGDRSYDAIRYDLHGELAGDHTLHATETITVAPGSSPIIELDSAVTVDDVQDLAFAVSGTTLRVDLSPIATGSDPVSFVVAYSAQPSGSLIVGGPRDNDPITGTVVYTDSEPDRGLRWLVAKHDPSDRAAWGVDFDLPVDQDLVANGVRRSDTPSAVGHDVAYELTKPIPTYMMAFAAGDLAHEERTTGRVPLALWHRRGLPVDAEAHFDAIASAMASFEALVGPYPWDSYAVFLAPLYGGGMENATITFNAESSGVGNIGFSLNAHELAHHWFGDWVTMQTYDDVWFKEGMATLLAAEADRPTRDRAGRGRLFGQDMAFDPRDAIVDPALHGLDKYTTGPYQRAAWLITQIRAKLGETTFWASLRGFLAAHALGSATGEDFLRSFPLDATSLHRAQGALTTRAVPTIHVQNAGGFITISIGDPEGTLLAPIGLTVVDASGAATPKQLAPQTPVALAPVGGYVALDEADVHPAWRDSFTLTDTEDAILRTVMVPHEAPAIAAFADRSAAVQELVLDRAGVPSTTSVDIASLYAALDSDLARRTLVLDACHELAANPAGLHQALDPLLATPAISVFSPAFASCGVAAPALTAELTQLAPNITAATAGRVDYLMSLDHGAAGFTPLAAIATGAPSLGLRDHAVQRLALQAVGLYTPVPAADVSTWQAFFRDRLMTTTSQTRLQYAWMGASALDDVVALAIVAPLLHSIPMTDQLQTQIVCDAFRIAGTSSAWTEFQTATKPWNTLSPTAAAALANPAGHCAVPRRAPRVPSKVRAEARDRRY